MKSIYLSILFSFLIGGYLVNCDIDWESDETPQLYFPNDTSITNLNVTNYKDALFNQDKVTVFQFYNSCKYCLIGLS